MATNKVKEIRQPLVTNPTGNFTLKRGEHKQVETVQLLSHFAEWLTKVTGVPVGAETACEDLANGVCLCKLLTMLPSSGVTKYHDVPSAKGLPLDAWKAKENMSAFQQACVKNLALPVTFGTAELEQQNVFKVASGLVFLVHTASAQGVGVQELAQDETLTERVRAVTGAASEEEEAARAAQDLPWRQQLLVKFGYDDWIDTLDPAKFREYVATLRKQAEERAAQIQTDAAAKRAELAGKLQQQTASFKESLPDAIKSRIA